MIIHDLSDVLLDHAELIFIDCETGDVKTLAMRATEQGCTGFQFDRGGNGFVPIFCVNKLQWITDVKDKNVVFVSDHWQTVQQVTECENVTVYYLMDPPNSHLLLCPILVALVCLSLFFS